jgi:mRNA interferase MazF
MANFEPWDIIKVPFPYTNRPVQQNRPALVVGQYSHPGSPALLWVLMITSAQHRRWHGDITVSDTGMAGLPAPSIIRCAKIATIEALDATKIGRLPLDDRALVRAAISAVVVS